MAETRRIDLGTHSLRVTDRAPRVAGEGAGDPPFVCLHGLVDTLEIWDRLAGALSEQRRTICVDQRGHGESGAPAGPYAREDLAADVIGVLDALGIERAVLVGHSMGGIISMTTAVAYPDRVAGMVLLGTASRCNERTAKWYERIAQAGEADGCDGLARAIYGDKSKRRVTGDANAISAVTRTLASLYTDPLTPKLESLDCPVLLLVGEKDPMGPRASEIIAEALPDSTLQVLPGCGHWIHVEASDEVRAAAAAWIG
ncbi:MAG: alpha/beta hydrolase [Deltaproteobacteria bacterium]|nr:alpha/beta hydrolase [Deltaproteobacteria bacterium]MBW2412908.1 alpha/beta hydrolase [Deltaproteobacteria bacterium]